MDDRRPFHFLNENSEKSVSQLIHLLMARFGFTKKESLEYVNAWIRKI